MAEGLEDEEVGAALGERGRLLGEGRLDAVVVPLARDARHEPGGPDRSADVGVLAGDLARDAGAGEVERAHLADQAVALEAEAVGAVGVGLDDLRPGLEVVGVDLADDVRPGDVELLEVLGDEDAALVEERAHRAVEHEERLLHGVEKRQGSTRGHHGRQDLLSTASAHGAKGHGRRS